MRGPRPRARAWRAPAPLAALLALLLLLLAGGPAAGVPAAEMPQAEVMIHGTAIRVDVADTPALQARGLGGREALGRDEGMLFVYAEKRRHAFWMKGMRIAIDIVWLDNRRVVHIEHSVPPPPPGAGDGALRTYRPGAPGNFVLELRAGRARELGLAVGDRVAYRFGGG